MADELISVIMTVYNGEKYLFSAIESIRNQTYANFEFIIVDDGSTDDSLSILQAAASTDYRVKVISLPQNKGICYALNVGVGIAKGNLIARMDADDIALARRLMTQKEFMDRNQLVAVCGCFVGLIDGTGKVIGHKHFPNTDLSIRNSLWFRNPLQHSSTMIRKKFLKDLGGSFYRENFNLAEDLDLWFRFSRIASLAVIQDELLLYRLHSEGSTYQKQKKMIIQTLRVRLKAVLEGSRISFKGLIFNALLAGAIFIPKKFISKLFILKTKSS